MPANPDSKRVREIAEGLSDYCHVPLVLDHLRAPGFVTEYEPPLHHRLVKDGCIVVRSGRKRVTPLGRAVAECLERESGG